MSALRGLPVLLIVLLIGGCADTPEPDLPEAPTPDLALSDSYLTGDQWDQGTAEFAFYDVTRTHDPYGPVDEQSFVVGSFVVKHDFDPDAQTKATGDADGEPAFKSAWFYSFESGSYEYKRSYVTNARQHDLRLFKHSFASFDWCSNQYHELAVQPDNTVDRWMRSDDYGNDAGQFAYREASFSIGQLPLLIRSLDVDDHSEHLFNVMHPDGTYVRAQAAFIRSDSLTLVTGTHAVEQITVTYDEPVPSMIAEQEVTGATYWRSTDDDRRLLRIEGMSEGDTAYIMTLVEHLWSAYWEENLWDRVEHIDERP